MKTSPCVICISLFSAGLVATVAFQAAGQDFYIEGGPVARGGMQVKVSGSSYVQMLGLHAASAPLSEPGSIGSRGAYADRTYEDGYVKLDQGTLNPDAVGGLGNTWNWAYDNTAQFNASAKTLSFHQQGEVGYTALHDNDVTGQDDAVGAGVQIQAGWNVVKQGNWRVDLGVGFQGIWGASSKISLNSYLERTSRLNTTDTYDVAATVDPDTGFPGPQTAPGGYAGQFSVPGPTITNIPSSRTSQRTDLSTAQNNVNFNFQTDFYELTFSPRIIYIATQTLALSLTPALGVSYIAVAADRTETFTETTPGGGTTTLGSWHDHTNTGGVRFAAGITAGADLELGKGYYAGILGGYQWAVDAVQINIGPNAAAVSGSGFVAGLVVGKRF